MPRITARGLIADAIAQFMPEGDDGQGGAENLVRADAVIASLSPYYEISVKSHRISPPNYPE